MLEKWRLMTSQLGNMSSSKGQDPSIRKRKAHKKSRSGCANCKIRRVKCDETKPACTRCQSFSLTCSYTTAASSATLYESIMQPAIPVMQLDFSQSVKPKPFSLPDTLLLPLGNGTTIELPFLTHGLIRDFEENIPLMDTAFDRLECKRIMMSLALKYPWLWHAILALVLIHQDLRAPLADEGKAPAVSDLVVPNERGFFITFHKLHAAMFLSRYLPEKHTADQDLQNAIFAGLALMGHVLWAAHDAPEGPYAAWPIRQPEDIDLEWLTICRSREAITQLIMPERLMGAFAGQRLIWGDQWGDQWPVASPGWSEEFELFPIGVRGLLDLDGASRVEKNPYHATASVMGKCLGIPAGKDSLCTYLSFLKVIDDRFLRMLKQKDLGALVVLVWWYARLLECGVVTEALRRAVVEGWAICLYLESWGGREGNIREALEYPKIVLRRFRDQVTNNWVGAEGKEGITLKLSLQAGTRDLKDL